MAEDAAQSKDFERGVEKYDRKFEQGRGGGRPSAYGGYKKRPPCCQRLCELSKPPKRYYLALWESFARTFGPEKINYIRETLQREYCMTPEDTEEYFRDLRKAGRRLKLSKKLIKRLKARNKRLKFLMGREQALRMLRRLLVRLMKEAYFHPKPIIMTKRLRSVAEVVLEQLCEIRHISVPDLGDQSKEAEFLRVISQWIAVGIEHIYYDVEVHKLHDIEQMQFEDEEHGDEETESEVEM